MCAPTIGYEPSPDVVSYLAYLLYVMSLGSNIEVESQLLSLEDIIVSPTFTSIVVIVTPTIRPSVRIKIPLQPVARASINDYQSCIRSALRIFPCDWEHDGVTSQPCHGLCAGPDSLENDAYGWSIVERVTSMCWHSNRLPVYFKRPLSVVTLVALTQWCMGRRI